MPVDEAACKFLEEVTLLDLHTLYNPLPFSFNSINYKFSDLFFFPFFIILSATTNDHTFRHFFLFMLFWHLVVSFGLFT